MLIVKYSEKLETVNKRKKNVSLVEKEKRGNYESSIKYLFSFYNIYFFLCDPFVRCSPPIKNN